MRPGDLADLVRAASICSLLWGGIRNPIIPVGAGAAVGAEELLELFEVDILYPVGESESISALLEKHQYLRAPHVGSHELFYENWHTKTNRLYYLDSLNIIEKHWEREFKYKPDEFKSNCHLVSWEDRDSLKDVMVISFGHYSNDFNLAENFHSAFLKGLHAHSHKIEADGAVPMALGRGISPLGLTALELRAHRQASRNASGLYFGDPENFGDLVDFWNLRATGSDVIFVPLSAIERFADFAHEHLKRLDESPHSHPNIKDRIAISFRHDQPKVSEALRRFDTKKEKVIYNRDGDRLPKASMFHFELEQALAHIDGAADGHTVTIPLPEKKFLANADRHVGDQAIAVSVIPYGEFHYPNHTLQPPYRRDLNEFYSRRIAFSPFAVRSNSDSLSVLTTVDAPSLRLHPIAKKAIVEEVFRLAGIRAETSQPGLLADRLVETLGGIDSARVFKIRGVRNLIAKLSSQDAVERGEATKLIYNDGQFAAHEDLYIERRDKDKLTSNDVFAFLLRKEFFRAGLNLECDRCHLESWQSLRQIDDIFVCEYCGHRNMTSLHLRHRGDWAFRKSGLLAKDNNQEGAIPVILSLLVFQRIFDDGKFIYSTSFHVGKGADRREIDYVVMQYDRGSTFECALGEAKSIGGQIDEDDVTCMKRVRDQLEGFGIRTYLAFSKTADVFLPDEIVLFRRLIEENIPLIILTNKEIEPYEPYSGIPEEDQLPHKHAMTMEDMAANSEFLYLR